MNRGSLAALYTQNRAHMNTLIDLNTVAVSLFTKGQSLDDLTFILEQ